MGREQTRRAFERLARAAARIAYGAAGRDFLVLEDDDEMYGYEETPAEKEFGEAVCGVVETRASRTRNASHVAAAITALVDVRRAVHAYRARMWQYATDHGSEVSPCALHARKLLSWVRTAVPAMSAAGRRRLRRLLTDEARAATFTSYWFASSDTHGSEEVSVAKLVGNG